MAALRGMEVTVLRPDGYALPDATMDRARAAAAAGGAYLLIWAVLTVGLVGSESTALAMAGAFLVGFIFIRFFF